MKLSNGLGRFLRSNRRAKYYNGLPIQQKLVAKKVGLSEQFWSDVERGRRFPSWRKLKRACEFLDIDFLAAQTIAKKELFKRWKGYGEP